MSFHIRLQTKLEEKGYKIADLARAAKVSPVAAGKWFHGTSEPKAGALKDIAGFLGVSDTWLLTGRGDPNVFDNNVDLSKKIPIEGRPIPVISWVAAGSFSPTETIIKDAEVDEWLPPNKDCGPNGYGLIVTGISMSPKFEIGDRLYVNPDVQTFDLHTDDLVIVSSAGDTEATFKCLIIEGGNKYLKPLNPNWPDQIIKLTEDCRLVGKVVGLYRKI
ncbi:LexA family protein [Acinetobacter rudis]|uniref:LexA family protein n=1 Tax=Acinetobacter rudis TaxID=632955 RepID=UPI003341A3B1